MLRVGQLRFAWSPPEWVVATSLCQSAGRYLPPHGILKENLPVRGLGSPSASISCLTVAVRMPDAPDGWALGCWSLAASSSSIDASLPINFCERRCLAFLKFLVSSSAWTVGDKLATRSRARLRPTSRRRSFVDLGLPVVGFVGTKKGQLPILTPFSKPAHCPG
jgi:hypothetical protein